VSISIFDLFTVGIGPSSSHTVGPMRAAVRFLDRLAADGVLERVGRVRATLYGSLALTGRGHGSDRAVLIGLEGETPEEVDPERMATRSAEILEQRRIRLLGRHEIAFDPATDLLFDRRKRLPLHSNGMIFTAFDDAGEVLAERTYYSIGGGFVVNKEEAGRDELVPDHTPLPYPYSSGAELLAQAERHALPIWRLTLANEQVWRDEAQVRAGVERIWQAMEACVERGCRQGGVLPGGLKVKRRAPEIYRELSTLTPARDEDPLTVLDWVNLYALAVNEENAAGGRVVTAPTNGAAGILPAVLLYYERHVPQTEPEGRLRFLLTAGAIGILYKENASISGAEVGCQGEVGVACSMAAGGLVAALGGSDLQVENAAEIGMEHNLGLTCDPIGGLVQIPCIERNAMGAVKAINAARIAMRGDGLHMVSLDDVIETMRQTGADMKTKYKETSRGGLAINVIEC
jgi:L-serine dehydratase